MTILFNLITDIFILSGLKDIDMNLADGVEYNYPWKVQVIVSSVLTISTGINYTTDHTLNLILLLISSVFLLGSIIIRMCCRMRLEYEDREELEEVTEIREKSKRKKVRASPYSFVRYRKTNTAQNRN